MADNKEEETHIGVGDKSIPLNSLNILQLTQLQKQLQAEVEGLTRNVSALGDAATRYQVSGECLAQMEKHSEEAKEDEKKSLLVPLSSSVYMDGFVAKKNDVLVDIGTGYYVKKDIAGAKAFLDGKMNQVQGNAQKIAGVVDQKKNLLSEVQGTIQGHVQAYQDQQGAAV